MPYTDRGLKSTQLTQYLELQQSDQTGHGSITMQLSWWYRKSGPSNQTLITKSLYVPTGTRYYACQNFNTTIQGLQDTILEVAAIVTEVVLTF